MVHVLLIFLRVIDARAFLMRTPTISNILIYFFIFFLKKNLHQSCALLSNQRKAQNYPFIKTKFCKTIGSLIENPSSVRKMTSHKIRKKVQNIFHQVLYYQITSIGCCL